MLLVFLVLAAQYESAEMRRAMGIAVFAGMIGVTFFGLLLTPVFFTTLRKLGPAKRRAASPSPAQAGAVPAE